MHGASEKTTLLKKGESLQSLEIAGFQMAEREGFEPSCACAQTDFESAPL